MTTLIIRVTNIRSNLTQLSDSDNARNDIQGLASRRKQINAIKKETTDVLKKKRLLLENKILPESDITLPSSVKKKHRRLN